VPRCHVQQLGQNQGNNQDADNSGWRGVREVEGIVVPIVEELKQVVPAG
jgi:hypothetical protein